MVSRMEPEMDGITYGITVYGPNSQSRYKGAKHLGFYATRAEAEQVAEAHELQPGSYDIGETISAIGVGKYFGGRS
jgi:hypothetical protein